MSTSLRNILRSAMVAAALFLSSASVYAGGEAKTSFPYVGSVSGDSVRLRTGPSTNHAIASVVAKADNLTVLGSKDGWLKVQMPLSSQCWISKSFTKIAGSKVTVTAKNVNLRIRPNTRNVPVGQASNEELVAVLEKGQIVERDGFVKVQPPKSATLWISDDFVTFSKKIDAKDDANQVKPAKALSEAESKAKLQKEEREVFKELELELASRLKQDGDRKLVEMKTLMEQFADSTEQSSIREAAKKWVAKIEKIDETLKKVAATKKANAEAELEAEELRRKQNEKRAKVLAEARALLKKPNKEAKTSWIAKGYVGDHGKNAKIPASHALFDENGKVIFYIRWDSGDLSGLWQKFVGITGTQKTHAGWDKPVVVIKKAEELPEERS